MNQFWNLVFSGLVTGAIYSIMASGLVLTFTTSGTSFELTLAARWPPFGLVLPAGRPHFRSTFAVRRFALEITAPA